MNYDKSQIGWFITVLFVLIIVSITVSYINGYGDRPLSQTAYYSLLILFVFLTLLFYKLRIKVNEQGISIIYGIGLIKFRIQPDKIGYVKKTKSPFFYGLGIRIIPGGMLYNIQGAQSVEVSYFKSKNKLVRIGSADCDNLISAIKERYQVN
jgi:hypothetical protein